MVSKKELSAFLAQFNDWAWLTIDRKHNRIVALDGDGAPIASLPVGLTAVPKKRSKQKAK